MKKTTNRVYHMLVIYGHSPEKAGQIIVDARRRNKHALDWIRCVHGLVPTGEWIERHQSARGEARCQ